MGHDEVATVVCPCVNVFYKMSMVSYNKERHVYIERELFVHFYSTQAHFYKVGFKGYSSKSAVDTDCINAGADDALCTFVSCIFRDPSSCGVGCHETWRQLFSVESSCLDDDETASFNLRISHSKNKQISNCNKLKIVSQISELCESTKSVIPG